MMFDTAAETASNTRLMSGTKIVSRVRINAPLLGGRETIHWGKKPQALRFKKEREAPYTGIVLIPA
jgi:hypothetical protein